MVIHWISEKYPMNRHQFKSERSINQNCVKFIVNYRVPKPKTTTTHQAEHNQHSPMVRRCWYILWSEVDVGVTSTNHYHERGARFLWLRPKDAKDPKVGTKTLEQKCQHTRTLAAYAYTL